MIKHFCDICGDEIKNEDELAHYRMQKNTPVAKEILWEDLEIHKECWVELCRELSARKHKESPRELISSLWNL